MSLRERVRSPELVKTRPIILISPHSDDPIISLGGSISNGRLPVFGVYNIFTRSNFRASGFDDVEKVTREREEEDNSVMHPLSIFPRNLGFLDGSIRYAHMGRDYMDPMIHPEQDSTFADIAEKVQVIIDENEGTPIFFPLGLGNHIDHRILATIGKTHSGKDVPVYFYEESSYYMTDDEEAVKRYVNTFYPTLTPALLPLDSPDQKLSLARQYQSQLVPEDLRVIENVARKRGGERIWATKNNISQLGAVNQF